MTPLVGRAILPLHLYSLAVEIQPHERWLAALPGKNNIRVVLPFDVLPDICVQHIQAHLLSGRGAQQLSLVQVIARPATEIAHRTHRFGHHMKSRALWRQNRVPFHGFSITPIPKSVSASSTDETQTSTVPGTEAEDPVSGTKCENCVQHLMGGKGNPTQCAQP